MVPVRASGRVRVSGKASPLASSDFARQLLYSVGFEDIQAEQLTTLQGFPQSLPGESSVTRAQLPAKELCQQAITL